MIAIKVSVETKQIDKAFGNLASKQAPFAISKTLNELAFTTSRQVMPKKAQEVFEGGATPFTRRGFKYKKSSKRKLSAFVYVDSKQEKYMKYMVEGGVKKPEGRALLSTAASSKLNKYGNFTRNTVNSMISNKVKFFSGVPKGMSESPSTTGIWERYGGNLAHGGKKIRQVARYKEKQAYKPVFRFDKYATDEVIHSRTGFTPRFQRNLMHAIRTAR